MLINLYPGQSASLTAKRDASMAALASAESANSIQAGITWGQSVADSIWAWRLTDGFTPPRHRSWVSSVLRERSQPWAPGGRHHWETQPALPRSSAP